MHYCKTILLIIFIQCFLVIYVQANPPERQIMVNSSQIIFDRLYIDDPDNQYFVEDILMDDVGFIWIASKEGLYRYDGSKLLPILQNIADSNQMAFQALLSIALHDDWLWISTARKLWKLDLNDFSLEGFDTPLAENPLSGNSYRGVTFADKNGIVYCGYWNGGMVMFDPDDQKMTHYFSQSESDSIPFLSNTITDIKARNDTTLWVAGHDGLFIYDKTTGSFTSFWRSKDALTDNLGAQVNTLLQVSERELWLGTNNGIVILDVSSKAEKRLGITTSPLSNHERNIIESLEKTSEGIVLAGTRYGLYMIHPVNYQMSAYFHQSHDPNTLQGNYIRKVFTDPTGITWLGHHSGNVSILSKRKKEFTTYALFSDYVADQRIHSVYIDMDTLWFGTETGLYRYEKATGKLTQYRNDKSKPGSISHDFISGIVKDSDGFFWIATDKGGINRFDQATGVFENLLPGSQNLASFSNSDIWTLMIDNTGTLWAGTGGDGIISFHTRTRQTMRFRHEPGNNRSLPSDFVGPIVRGNDGTVWIGTLNEGISYFKPGTDQFYQLPLQSTIQAGVAGRSITSLLITPENLLYIGSELGIDIYDIDNQSFKSFQYNDAIPGQSVKSLLLDRTGCFWIAARNGLMKYDPYKNDYQLFFKSDGLSSNNFLPESVHQSANGEILMGTQNGFISFFPWLLTRNTRKPPVVVTDIQVLDKSLIFNTQQSTLVSNKKITLGYQQNNITFHFSSLDFNNPSKNQLQYQLIGHDPKPVKVLHNGQVNYNNLPPGEYTFRVIGSNNDNIWNMQGETISFVIKPPFWDTIIFKLLVFVFIVSAIFMFIWLQVKKVHSQKKELERLVAIRTAELNEQKISIENQNRSLENQKNAIEHQALLLSKTNSKLQEQKVAIEKQARELKEMDRLKSGFFASISHEFRTPLTLIINALAMLKSNETDIEKDGNSEMKINIIKKNAHRLQKLIDQLLDLIKIESGFMKLTVSRGNIHDFIQSVASLFTVKAQAEKISFKTSVNLNNPEGFVDWDKLEKITYNLLSNAIKFTSAKGHIWLRVTDHKNESTGETLLKLEVQDNGCGIEPDLHTRVFSMFFHSEQARRENKSSTGIGLALAKQLAQIHKGDISLQSEPGVGSVFTLEIPVSESSYALAEKVTAYSYQIPESEIEAALPMVLPELPSNQSTLPHLLFVDDNKELCYIIREQLNSDFQVEVAFDGVQGFEKAISSYPDIIVSDLMMPGISGIDFCKRIKEDIRTEHLPFLLLTARTDQKAEVQAFENLCDDYITKPYSIDVLRLKLINLLRIRKKTEEKLRKELDNAQVHKTNLFSNRFMSEAVKIIHNQMDDPDFTVDTLAGKLNMSRTQLYRKSEKLLGMSANNFIKKIKLAAAFELLNDGGYNISEIAYKVGFKTPGYFSRCFEEQYGVLPSKMLSDIQNAL